MDLSNVVDKKHNLRRFVCAFLLHGSFIWPSVRIYTVYPSRSTLCRVDDSVDYTHFLTSNGLSALASAPFSSLREKITANVGSPFVCSCVGMYALPAPLSSLERLAVGASSILWNEERQTQLPAWTKTVQSPRQTSGRVRGESVTWLNVVMTQ